MIEIRKDSRSYGQDDHEGSSEGSSKILEEFSGPVAAGRITAGSTPSSPADGFDDCHFTPEPTPSCEIQPEETEEEIGDEKPPQPATIKAKGKKKSRYSSPP